MNRNQTRFVPFYRAMLWASLGWLPAIPSAQAQQTIPYVDSEVRATPIDTSAPNDPTTLTIGSGFATQSGVVSGAGAIRKEGAGTIALTGSNTYLGDTLILDGILQIGADVNLGNAASRLTLDGGTLRTTESFTTSRDTVLESGNGTFRTDNGTKLTHDGILSGDGRLIKRGGGNLELSGTNTYTGGTRIFSGSVQVTADENLGDASGDLRLNDGGLRVLDTFATSRDTILNGLGGEISISNNETLFHSGVIEGTGPFTKLGNGSLVLSGANTFSGGTLLSAGEIVVGNDNAFGTGPLVIEGGTTLSSDGPQRITNDVFVNGDFSVFPEGTTVLISAFEIDGNVNLGGETRTITSLSDFNSFEFGQARFGGVISNGGLHLAATGAPGDNVAFFSFDGSGANTYTGPTTVGSNVSLTLEKDAGVTAVGGDLTIKEEGALVIRNSEQIVDSSAVSIEGNGRMQVGVDSDVTETIGSISDDGSGDGNISIGDFVAGSTLRVGSGSFSGTIEEGVAGSVSLEKYGPGTLELSGTNTYLGDTLVSGGTLQVSADENLGDSGSGLILDDGVLRTTESFTTARDTVLESGNGTFRTNNGTKLTHDGAISGDGRLIKRGGGNLELSGTNTYTGGTRIFNGAVRVSADENLGDSSGDLRLNDGRLRVLDTFTTARSTVLNGPGGEFSIANNETLTHEGVIEGGGALTKLGNGTLELMEANTYSGGTLLSAGTLVVGNNNALGTGPLVIQDGTTLATPDAFLPFTSYTVNNDIFVQGDFDVLPAGQLVAISSFNLNGDINLTNGTRTITNLSETGPVHFGGVISNGGLILDADPFNVEAFFQFNGTNANTYTGETLIGEFATLTLSKSDNVTAIAGDVVIEDFGRLITRSDEQIADTSTVFMEGESTFRIGLLNNKTETINILADDDSGLGLITLNGLINGSTLRVAEGSFSGDITGGGAISTSLVKYGPGNLRLTGFNDYRGDTRIEGGVLIVEADENLGTQGGLILDPSRLIFDGGRLRTTDSFETERDTVLESGGGTLSPVAGTLLTHSGTISGSGSLSKRGAGDLLLEGTNTYTGGTGIFNGRVGVSADENLGDASGELFFNGGTLRTSESFETQRETTLGIDGGMFQTASGTQLTHSGTIGGSGFLLKTGAGDLLLEGTNTYTDGTGIFNGRLIVSSDENLGDTSGDLLLNGGTLRVEGDFATTRTTFLRGSGGAIGVRNGNTLTHNGLLRGAGGLAKRGAGTLELNSANIYQGGTLINNGTLVAGNPNALGTGELNLNGGTLHLPGNLNLGDDFNWAGGSVSSVLGSSTSLIDIDGALNLTGTGEFLFNPDAGFSNETEYLILDADSPLAYDSATDFAGNDLFGLSPEFKIVGEQLFVIYPGSVYSSGAVLQNSIPVGTPFFSEFIVSGNARTGTTGESNRIRGLDFKPGSSLQVFNTLTVSDGNFIVGSGTGTLNGGLIFVPQTFTKRGGGSLVVNSDVNVQGATFVDQGSLYINGNFFSGFGFNVGPNGLLGGTGNLIGNLANNGIVAPGNSIGTLTVNGNYTQSPGGTLQMEIQNPSFSDRINITGAAFLAGTLGLEVIGNGLSFGDVVTLITAQGGINGGFDQISGVPAGFRARPWLTNGNQAYNLIFAPRSYTQVAQGENQMSLAAALDQWIGVSSPEIASATLQLDLLTAGAYPIVFEALLPSIYGSLTSTTFSQSYGDGRSVNQQALFGLQRLRALAAASVQESGEEGAEVSAESADATTDADAQPRPVDHGWRVWADARGMYSTDDPLSLDSEGGTILAGADVILAKNLLGGFYLGGQSQESRDSSPDYQSEGPRFGLYGLLSFLENAYLSGVFGMGTSDVSVTRPLAFGGSASGDTDGTDWFTRLETGYTFKPGGFLLTPFAGLQYSSAEFDGFTESSDSVYALEVDDWGSDRFEGFIGADIARPLPLEGQFVLLPYVRLTLRDTFSQDDDNLNSSLLRGAGPTFAYTPDEVNGDGFEYGAGLRLSAMETGWSLNLGYTGFSGDDGDFNQVNLGFSWDL